MRILKRIVLLTCYSLLTTGCFAQDSSHIRISLLTCTPGDELYSTFGHSALRVTDSSSNTDIVYNYGTFNFEEKNFYIHFIRGKLAYYLSTEYFQDFKADYQQDHRGMTEQVLNLSAVQKQKVEQLLLENIKEENRFYKYDFFFDNCTSRLRDIIQHASNISISDKNIIPAGATFRQAIHAYLDNGKEYWSELGIDILLGAKTDAVMTPYQSEFLPDNLMKGLDSSRHLVIEKTDLYSFDQPKAENSFFTPFIVFSLLLLLIILLDLIKNNFIQRTLQGFDGLLFFITGITGILLILMWTATDHSMCRYNMNLLWTWPTNCIIAFFLPAQKKWVKKYLLIHAIVLSILLLTWAFLPQQLNNALIPIVLLLIYRSMKNYLKADA